MSFSTGAMSKFSKGDWYCATGDYGWSGSDRLDFLPELLMEKYRSQRRLIGGAYTSTYMKEIEPHLNVVLERNLAAMRQQAGESVNADTYFSYFSSGQSAIRCLDHYLLRSKTVSKPRHLASVEVTWSTTPRMVPSRGSTNFGTTCTGWATFR